MWLPAVPQHRPLKRLPSLPEGCSWGESFWAGPLWAQGQNVSSQLPAGARGSALLQHPVQAAAASRGDAGRWACRRASKQWLLLAQLAYLTVGLSACLSQFGGQESSITSSAASNKSTGEKASSRSSYAVLWLIWFFLSLKARYFHPWDPAAFTCPAFRRHPSYTLSRCQLHTPFWAALGNPSELRPPLSATVFTQIILFVKYLGEMLSVSDISLRLPSRAFQPRPSRSAVHTYGGVEMGVRMLACWSCCSCQRSLNLQIRSVCATYLHRETASPTREFLFSVSRVREKQRRGRLSELLKVLQTTCDGVGRLYQPGFKTITNSSHPLLSWEGCRYALAFQPGVAQPPGTGRHALQKAMQCCQGPGGLLAQTLLQGYIEQSFAFSSAWQWVHQIMPGLLTCWWWMLKIPLC